MSKSAFRQLTTILSTERPRPRTSFEGFLAGLVFNSSLEREVVGENPFTTFKLDPRLLEMFH